MKKFFVLIWVLPVVFCGCATHDVPADPLPPPLPQREQVRTPSSIMEELGGNDPIEPFNRAMFQVNDVLMHYGVRPFSWLYGSILPQEAIQRVQMVSDNLAFPGRFVSCLLQAKFKASGIVFTRFLMNSTVGIAGIFDPADAWLGMQRRYENMGHAFASWGIGPGFVLFLPLSTSINFRDQVGLLFDSALDLKLIIPYAGSVAGVNRAVNLYDDYVSITETATDPYDYMKMGFVATRFAQVNDFQEKPLMPSVSPSGTAPELPDKIFGERIIRISDFYQSQGSEVDTVKFVLFGMRKNNVSAWVKSSLWNTDFVSAASSRSVQIKEGLPDLNYQLWSADAPDRPLVVLLPGIGGHYKGPQLRAMAELVHENGSSVVVVSSAFNSALADAVEFRYPGYTPEDASRLRIILKAVLKDIRENSGLKPSRTILAGYSMGGLHALFIADMERREPTLGISRYVALNPPVDLQYALSQFDSFAEISRKWSREEFSRQMGDIVMKYYYILSRKYTPLSSRDKTPQQYNLPFSRDQAAFMAGLALRLTLRELLLAARRRQEHLPEIKTGFNWWSRADLYRELDTFTAMKYVRVCLLPQQQKKDSSMTLEKMNRDSGLRAIEETLRNDPSVRILHNANDPLISETDKRFLTDALGSKITWFDCGGHLGALFVEDYQKAFLYDLESSGQPAIPAVCQSEKKIPSSPNPAGVTSPSESHFQGSRSSGKQSAAPVPPTRWHGGTGLESAKGDPRTVRQKAAEGVRR